jgi:adenosylmethionine-8-amino-7-oxononanoate aminotransferase
VKEVRGVGLMLGIELAEGEAAQVERGARASGVIVRATGQKVVLSPPFVIERAQMDRIAEVLAEELEKL